MKIELNGEQLETTEKTVLALRNTIFGSKPGVVVILNGHQLNEDHPLSSGDEVFFIEKGVMPSQRQLEKMMAARHTPKVHDRVKQGKVAIAGLGGLGSNIAVALARIGVGSLLLVDFDVVEPSNLNRQSYYVEHLGRPKTEALSEQLRKINPYITIHAEQVKIDETNANRLFEGYGIVCEAFDSPKEKAMLINTLLTSRSDVKIVAASGLAGYESANTIRTDRKLKNLYVCGDGENEARPGRGLMAPRVLVCAGHQATMVLRLLMCIEDV